MLNELSDFQLCFTRHNTLWRRELHLLNKTSSKQASKIIKSTQASFCCNELASVNVCSSEQKFDHSTPHAQVHGSVKDWIISIYDALRKSYASLLMEELFINKITVSEL